MPKIIPGLYRTPQPRPPDTTPPTAPTSLSVSLVGNVPHLTWTASTDNIQVAGYQVWRKTGSGGTYAQIGISLVTSYDDSTAASGNTYFYKVFAYDTAIPVANVSSASNEVSQAVSSSDVTAPNVPGQPAAATVDNSTNPPKYTTNWSAVSDVNPGDGSPVSGVKDYLVYHDYPVAGTLAGTVSQTGNVGSPAPYVIGTNSGGSAVTGSDSGTVISSTSTTSDVNAQHWGTSDEFFFDAAPVQGAGSAVWKVTAVTNANVWSKRGLELRADLSAGAPYCNLVYFGANGLKPEQRAVANQAAVGGSVIADPGLPLWMKLIWDAAWNVTRQYSTNSTNGVDGTWTTIDTVAMGSVFGTTAFIGKFVDADTAWTTGVVGGTASATYSNYAVTGASPIVFQGNGVAGQTLNVTVKARDNAGNISAASAARSVTFAAASGNTHKYPRTGGYIIAGTVAQQTLQTASDRANVAKLKVVMIGGYANSHYQGAAMTRDQVVTDCKSRSASLSTALKVIQYMNYLEQSTTRSSAILPEWWDFVNNNNWWMYRAGTSGTKTPSPFNSSWGVLNPSHFCPKDGSNLYPGERLATHAYNFLNLGTYGAYNVSTHLDGIYLDVTDYKPYGSGALDMNRDGTADNVGDATVQHNWRIGVDDVMVKWAALTGLLAGGNMATHFQAAIPNYNDPTVIDPYNTNFALGLYENMLGSYNGERSEEYWVGTAQTLASYHWEMSALQAPKYLVCYHACNADGSDEITPSPSGQAARYGKALVSMNDGYWYGTQGQGGMLASRIMDLDEDFGGALNDYNWLGPAVEGPTAQVSYSQNTYVINGYQNGVCKREFLKGVTVMWPTGNTSSITLPYPTKRLTGSVNPSVNNGQTYAAGAAISPPGGTGRNGLFLIKT